MNNPPVVTVYLDVPADCRMAALLDFEDALHFTLGTSQDQQNIVFERQALERFAQLAHDALAMRVPADRKSDWPTVVAS